MYEKEAEEYVKAFTDRSHIWSNDKLMQLQLREAYKDGAEFGYNKANEELEEKISVLLSCKNCPENKDGLICQKEYENKCLAQKIQYIKELKEENAELKAQIEKKMEEIRTDNTETLKNALKRIAELEKEYASLKGLRKYELNVAKLEIEKLEKENAELKEKLKPENCLKLLLAKEGYIKFTSDQLTKAKEIIEELYNIIPASMSDYAKEPMEHARKFMTEE